MTELEKQRIGKIIAMIGHTNIEERYLIFERFCKECYRELSNGEKCTCTRDE